MNTLKTQVEVQDDEKIENISQNTSIIESKFEPCEMMQCEQKIVKIHNAKEPNLFHHKYFLMWENNSNVCWLDCSMTLLVYNQTMRQSIHFNPECQVSKIIKCYDKAIAIVNDNTSKDSIEDKLKIARELLHEVQESALKYLQPIVKYTVGEPDSAFCSLYNLISEDNIIRGFFNISYKWVRECSNCKFRKPLICKKPIITISKVATFKPCNPECVCHCPSCKEPNQKMKLEYGTLPPTLIFHFENGAGSSNTMSLNFILHKRSYYLVGLMSLEKGLDSSMNHFVYYVRNPFSGKWLECNDLNPELVEFSPDTPSVNVNDIYMIIYEAFDELGTVICNESASKDLLHDTDNDIPCIDIADEADEVKSDTQNINSEENLTEFLGTDEGIDILNNANKRDLTLAHETGKDIKILNNILNTTDINMIEKCPVAASSSEIQKLDHENIDLNAEKKQVAVIKKCSTLINSLQNENSEGSLKSENEVKSIDNNKKLTKLLQDTEVKSELADNLNQNNFENNVNMVSQSPENLKHDKNLEIDSHNNTVAFEDSISKKVIDESNISDIKNKKNAKLLENMTELYKLKMENENQMKVNYANIPALKPLKFNDKKIKENYSSNHNSKISLDGIIANNNQSHVSTTTVSRIHLQNPLYCNSLINSKKFKNMHALEELENKGEKNNLLEPEMSVNSDTLSRKINDKSNDVNSKKSYEYNITQKASKLVKSRREGKESLSSFLARTNKLCSSIEKPLIIQKTCQNTPVEAPVKSQGTDSPEKMVETKFTLAMNLEKENQEKNVEANKFVKTAGDLALLQMKETYCNKNAKSPKNTADKLNLCEDKSKQNNGCELSNNNNNESGHGIITRSKRFPYIFSSIHKNIKVCEEKNKLDTKLNTASPAQQNSINTEKIRRSLRLGKTPIDSNDPLKYSMQMTDTDKFLKDGNCKSVSQVFSKFHISPKKKLCVETNSSKSLHDISAKKRKNNRGEPRYTSVDVNLPIKKLKYEESHSNNKSIPCEDKAVRNNRCSTGNKYSVNMKAPNENCKYIDFSAEQTENEYTTNSLESYNIKSEIKSKNWKKSTNYLKKENMEGKSAIENKNSLFDEDGCKKITHANPRCTKFIVKSETKECLDNSIDKQPINETLSPSLHSTNISKCPKVTISNEKCNKNCSDIGSTEFQNKRNKFSNSQTENEYTTNSLESYNIKSKNWKKSTNYLKKENMEGKSAIENKNSLFDEDGCKKITHANPRCTKFIVKNETKECLDNSIDKQPINETLSPSLNSTNISKCPKVTISNEKCNKNCSDIGSTEFQNKRNKFSKLNQVNSYPSEEIRDVSFENGLLKKKQRFAFFQKHRFNFIIDSSLEGGKIQPCQTHCPLVKTESKDNVIDGAVDNVIAMMFNVF